MLNRRKFLGISAVSLLSSANLGCGGRPDRVRADAGRTQLDGHADHSPGITFVDKRLIVAFASWSGVHDHEEAFIFTSDDSGATWGKSIDGSLGQDLGDIALCNFKDHYWLGVSHSGQLGLFEMKNNGTRIQTDATNYAPGLCMFKDKLFFAFTGTDNNIYVKSVENGHVIQGVVIEGQKTDNGVALATDGGQLFLAFAGTDHKLRILMSDNGSNFQVKRELQELSDRTPGLAWGNSRLYIFWKGIDNSFLNVMSIDPDQKHMYPDKSTDEGVAGTVRGTDVWMTWRGTDDQHHGNAMQVVF